MRGIIGTGCGLVALAIGVAACGGSASSTDNSSAGTAGGSGTKSLTIYSSLPLQGDSRQTSVDVSAGERLALEDAGGTAGKFAIKYVSLDDATAAAGKWDPGQVSANARKAAQDRSAIAYLGEYNSGATAISLPILNEAGLLQVSPSNTYVGLTRSEGAAQGEPDKYYPTGHRTFGRVVRTDRTQAAAQVAYQRKEGCRRIYLLNDREVYGKGLADQVAAFAKAQGIAVAANQGIDTKAANYRGLAQSIHASGADCFFFGGVTANNAVQLWKDVHASNPDMKLFGPDGVAEDAFTSKIGPAQNDTFLTVPVLPPDRYPPAGRRFFLKFKEKYGHEPAPYAIYGYEAMKTALLAIAGAGDKGDDRQAVTQAFFGIKRPDSVLGSYSIDPNGDTTLASEGGYRVKDGKQVFDTVLRAKPTS